MQRYCGEEEIARKGKTNSMKNEIVPIYLLPSALLFQGFFLTPPCPFLCRRQKIFILFWSTATTNVVLIMSFLSFLEPRLGLETQRALPIIPGWSSELQWSLLMASLEPWGGHWDPTPISEHLGRGWAQMCGEAGAELGMSCARVSGWNQWGCTDIKLRLRWDQPDPTAASFCCLHCSGEFRDFLKIIELNYSAIQAQSLCPT